jgi:predicted RNA-binding protein
MDGFYPDILTLPTEARELSRPPTHVATSGASRHPRGITHTPPVMAYFLDLFSPETYEAFSATSRSVSGFRERHETVAKRISPGDKLICYMTKLSRWIGVLEVLEGPYRDHAPLFYPEDDPFVVRFHVKPLIWLPKEKAIPIHEDEIWNTLSFTREQDRRTSTWTGKLRGSLVQLDDSDGEFLEKKLREQTQSERSFKIDEQQYRKLIRHTVRTPEKVVTVSVPEDGEPESVEVTQSEVEAETRESIRIQALIAQIGAHMGMRIWLPRNDRSRVLQEWKAGDSALLENLPLRRDNPEDDRADRRPLAQAALDHPNRGSRESAGEGTSGGEETRFLAAREGTARGELHLPFLRQYPRDRRSQAPRAPV